MFRRLISILDAKIKSEGMTKDEHESAINEYTKMSEGERSELRL